jgi:hypothetical protein
MNIQSLLQALKDKLSPREPLQDEVVIRFFKLLEQIREEDMSCDDMYRQLDEFVEHEVKSQDASKIMPLVQEHIDFCSDCEDEYEALLTVLENTKEK